MDEMIQQGNGMNRNRNQLTAYGLQQSPYNGIGLSPASSFVELKRRYLIELLTERKKLEPFVQVLPYCTKLLDAELDFNLIFIGSSLKGVAEAIHEIMRASGLHINPCFNDHSRMITHESPMRSPNYQLIGELMGVEDNNVFQGNLQASSMDCHEPLLSAPLTVKKIVKLDIPVDEYPNYNFIGRILGPRGNTLKRVEAMTKCRIFIRGQGSVKDSVKEEKLRGRPGYEHLSEKLHVLVEAELPEDIVDIQLNQAVTKIEDLLRPVNELNDQHKMQQLKELAILNGTWMGPTATETTIKRAKTGK